MVEILIQAEPRVTVFNHVSINGITVEEVLEEIRAAYGGRVEMGEDLMRIMVGEEVTIRSH